MPTQRDVIQSSISAELLAKGVELPAATTPSLAWKTSDALQVIDQLEKAGILILGGDVWRLASDARIRPAYANWYYDGEMADATQEDVKVAATQARDYVRTYPSDSSILFGIVLGPPEPRHRSAVAPRDTSL